MKNWIGEERVDIQTSSVWQQTLPSYHYSTSDDKMTEIDRILNWMAKK